MEITVLKPPGEIVIIDTTDAKAKDDILRSLLDRGFVVLKGATNANETSEAIFANKALGAILDLLTPSAEYRFKSSLCRGVEIAVNAKKYGRDTNWKEMVHLPMPNKLNVHHLGGPEHAKWVFEWDRGLRGEMIYEWDMIELESDDM
ncbi:MAG: hypothetical protein M1815_000077 [Lichina confinis]|nr:MAG: hypothetical protein M1815_000077 [Lichina confinis]